MMRPVGLDELLGLGLSPRTAYAYARIIDRVESMLGQRGTDLSSCTAVDVAAVVQGWRASNASRGQLRAALVRAWELLERDDPPLRALRVPPKPRARSRALEPDSATKLEQEAWNRRDLPGLAVLIGLYAGLRRFEIANLRWEDVVVDEHGTPTWLRVLGKGEVLADVPVHPVLARALGDYYRRAGGWIFPGRTSAGPVHPGTIWAYVRQVAADAGLAVVPTHVLRHTALAEANDRSGDLRAVQEIARHARPETTAGYTRVTSERLRRVVGMIDYGRTLEDVS